MINLGGQQPLPGMSDLDSRLGFYLGAVQERIESQAEARKNQAWLAPLQDAVWANFRRDILEPREQVWLEATEELRAASPVDVSSMDKTTQDFLIGTWRFVRHQQQEDSVVELTTEVRGGAMVEELSPEFQAAWRYLHPRTHEKYRGGEFSGSWYTVAEKWDWRNSPDQLLGIAAVGRGRKRHFPHDELQTKLIEHLPNQWTWLKVKVTANADDGYPAENLCEASVIRDEHDQTVRPDMLKPGLYSANMMIASCMKKYGPELTPEAMMQYLREGLDQEVGKSYQTLLEVTQLIRESAPLPPQKP